MFIYESIFLISPLIAVLMLFWYKTDFVLVYGKIFGLKNLLKITNYEIARKTNIELKYNVFLAINYNNFFIKLLSCQICFSTWLSILFTSIFSIINLNFWLILLIPFNIILGNLLYNLIHKNI